jgi:hypothetical protein
MNDETKMVELTDAELDAVTGGLNVLGSMAQDLGGKFSVSEFSMLYPVLGAKPPLRRLSYQTRKKPCNLRELDRENAARYKPGGFLFSATAG